MGLSALAFRRVGDGARSVQTCMCIRFCHVHLASRLCDRACRLSHRQYRCHAFVAGTMTYGTVEGPFAKNLPSLRNPNKRRLLRQKRERKANGARLTTSQG